MPLSASTGNDRLQLNPVMSPLRCMYSDLRLVGRLKVDDNTGKILCDGIIGGQTTDHEQRSKNNCFTYSSAYAVLLWLIMRGIV